MRKIFLAVFAATTLLITGAIAQHEGHHPDGAAPPEDKSAAMPMTGMMGQMMPMMTAHADASRLADQLVKGFAAIESEKNPTALKQKLAEHGRLLNELQTKLDGQTQMMEHMHAMMMGEHQKQ